MFELIQKRKRIAQVVLVLLIIPFAFFGLEQYSSSVGGRSDVATVNGSSITQEEFDEALRSQRERLRAAFGPASTSTRSTRRRRAARCSSSWCRSGCCSMRRCAPGSP
jgi:hypothetical protein